jgi:hypothetical protein
MKSRLIDQILPTGIATHKHYQKASAESGKQMPLVAIEQAKKEANKPLLSNKTLTPISGDYEKKQFHDYMQAQKANLQQAIIQKRFAKVNKSIDQVASIADLTYGISKRAISITAATQALDVCIAVNLHKNTGGTMAGSKPPLSRGIYHNMAYSLAKAGTFFGLHDMLYDHLHNKGWSQPQADMAGFVLASTLVGFFTGVPDAIKQRYTVNTNEPSWWSVTKHTLTPVWDKENPTFIPENLKMLMRSTAYCTARNGIFAVVMKSVEQQINSNHDENPWLQIGVGATSGMIASVVVQALEHSRVASLNIPHYTFWKFLETLNKEPTKIYHGFSLVLLRMAVYSAMLVVNSRDFKVESLGLNSLFATSAKRLGNAVVKGLDACLPDVNDQQSRNDYLITICKP